MSKGMEEGVMSKVFLFVDITIKPGKRDSFLPLLQKHISVIRTEKGLEFLDAYFDTENENKICAWEVWASREDWDDHMANENSKNWRPIAADYVEGETIRILRQP